MNSYVMDQNVSKIKFEKDMRDYEELKKIYEKRGWEVISNSFPLFIVSLNYKYKGREISFLRIQFDYTNYNILPLEVKILHPTDVVGIETNAYLFSKKDGLLRIIYDRDKFNIIVINHEYTKIPFLCMVGTREYHSHTQHDKDFWDLYRYGGNGSLGNILNCIWSGSVNSYTSFTSVPVILSGQYMVLEHPNK